MRKFTKSMLAISLAAVTGVASAVPISGVLKFGGAAYADFDTNFIDIDGDRALVTDDPTGTFATEGVAFGDLADYNDFSYDPLNVSAGVLWSVGDFTFTLTEITFVNEDPDNNFVDLQGVGIISYTGTSGTYEDTDGFWSFSADGTSAELAFSSTTVPEPALLSLMGLGLLGVGAARKLRKAA